MRITGNFHAGEDVLGFTSQNGISASYDNGVLSVVIPVSEKAKPRKIEVQSAQPSQEQPSQEQLTA